VFKSVSANLLAAGRNRRSRRNLRTLGQFVLVLAGMITAYSVLFHALMLREGQEHTWVTGFYWTLTVMSTLGFGDITFHTDLGRGFSILVLLSGMIFLLVLLPFTFIEFFYEPWMEAQADARAPRQLPEGTRGHVLLTQYDPVTQALIKRLGQYHYRYVLLVNEVEEALRLQDLGLDVMVGEADDPEAWQCARVANAALVATTGTDVANTNVAMTVRGVAERVPIIATATDLDSVDVLELAGANHVLRLEEMIGSSFARRVGGDALAHEIGHFDGVLIAEAVTRRTPLVGKTLRESNLREKVGVTVIGIWDRGSFEAARAETRIRDDSVLVLAGTRESLFRYDELFCIYNVANAPVVILGGGRVGRATARALAARDIDYRIVEKVPDRVRDRSKLVVGNAGDLEVLKQAGIEEAPTVIITPHDDDLNVYLTVYCRRLRPDIQILSRATVERNVATLHRAGADIVLSYASMGASTMMNLLKRSRILMVAEGLDLFRVKVPKALAGSTLLDSAIRERTGCSVVALGREQGMQLVPGADTELEADAEMLLIGSIDAEERFLELFPSEGPVAG
jgi:Trk K+ transport system NAD-binding subunit